MSRRGTGGRNRCLLTKRMLDVAAASAGLVVASPVLVAAAFLVWKQDRKSPLYIAARVGLDGREFDMIKLRSMVVGADSSGVDSTGIGDARITPVGQFIRRYKLDEVAQLWNVLIGDMSLVGPRPNVARETDLYTSEERGLLEVKPGITDFASIVFSDEGEILDGFEDPDLAYNQLIRPGKSRLGLFYVANQSIILDCALVVTTIISLGSRAAALGSVARLLTLLGADNELRLIASRSAPLTPLPPPGSLSIVSNR